MKANILKIVAKFKKIENHLNSYIYEREDMIHNVSIAIAGNLNMVAIGPPGTAKSQVNRHYFNNLDTSVTTFSTQLFTAKPPEEVLGPPDLKGLRDGISRRNMSGYLATANLVDLDEIFKAAPVVLNSLLSLANSGERFIMNGGEKLGSGTLLSILGSSNEIPDKDDGLEALWDRFQLRLHVQPIQDYENKARLVKRGKDPKLLPKNERLTFDELNTIRDFIANAKLEVPEGVYETLFKIENSILSKGLHISNRQLREIAIQLLPTVAILDERMILRIEDLESMQWCCWMDPKDRRTMLRCIYEKTSPEKDEILRLYDDIIQWQGEINAIKDSKDRCQKTHDLSKNLARHKDRIYNLIEDMKRKNVNIRQVMNYYKRAIRINEQLVRDNIGLDQTFLLS